MTFVTVVVLLLLLLIIRLCWRSSAGAGRLTVSLPPPDSTSECAGSLMVPVRDYSLLKYLLIIDNWSLSSVSDTCSFAAHPCSPRAGSKTRLALGGRESFPGILISATPTCFVPESSPSRTLWDVSMALFVRGEQRELLTPSHLPAL